MSIKHKYIITGGLGTLGSNLTAYLPKNSFLVISRNSSLSSPKIPVKKIDLSTWEKINMSNYNDYDIVIHAAAKTHIDACEAHKHLGKSSAAWRDNVVATERIVNFCKKGGKKLIFLSTECVFNGDKKSYIEEDHPNPKNWYGQTKLESEKIALSLSNSTIIRSVLFYGSKTGTKPDISKSIRQKLQKKVTIEAVVDQKISFTFIDDLIEAIIKSIEYDLKGTYHFCGQEAISPYQFALTICDILGFDKNLVKPVSLVDYFGKEKASLRLKNCVLNSKKFMAETGLIPNSLETGLRKFFKIENK